MAETLLDNLHNDQAETKSILEYTPNENFAAQPVEPVRSQEYTIDELQGDLVANRGVENLIAPQNDNLNPATTVQAPQPEAKETPLTTAQPIEESSDNAGASEPKVVTPVKKSNIMNFATGEYLDDNVSDRQKADYLSANRAFQRIIDLYDSYENPTMADIEAAIGEDATAFNKVYGSRGQNWANAFGAGAFGQLTKASMAKINDLVNTYRTRQGAEKQAAYDQAVAEHENQYKVKYGDNEIAVDKEFSDNIKSMVNAAMRSAASVNDNSTPEQIAAAKAEQAKIANDIKAALEAKGVAFDPNVPINGIDDIVNAAAGDYITKDAVGDILDKAMARKEYTQPEEKSLDDRLRERAELKELVDARNRAREIQRAKSRTGMVGIAALIGDMIRASEGAPVSQRDYQRIYDNLDAQARANINNYNIRMQKIKDDANRMRLAQMNLAARQAEKEAALAAKAAEGAANRDFKKDENQKDRDLKRELAELKNAGALQVQYARNAGGNGKGSGSKGATINIAGHIYRFNNNKDADIFMSGLSDIIRDASLYPAGTDVPTINLKDNYDAERRSQETTNFVTGWLYNKWSGAPKAVKDRITQYLQDNSYRISGAADGDEDVDVESTGSTGGSSNSNRPSWTPPAKNGNSSEDDLV